MQLPRTVIGEASRFPALGKALYESGPKRAITAMAAMLQRLAGQGLLRIDDAAVAAAHFNWLVMSQPLNQAMLLGDTGIPKPAALRRHAADAVGVFLAAFGHRQGQLCSLRAVDDGYANANTQGGMAEKPQLARSKRSAARDQSRSFTLLR